MNCPRCGNELRISRKDPRFGLCDTCRKKYRLPEQKAPQAQKEEEEHYPKYANIPPKAVREKRETEMRRAYDELLAIGKEEREREASLAAEKNPNKIFSIFLEHAIMVCAVQRF